MAAKKMTFTLPEDLAAQLLKRVPSRDRSRYVSEALAEKLAERDRQLARACDAANQDPDVVSIEREFDSFADDLVENLG